MTLLERRTVSRKTAGDGRLEIMKPTAQRLERLRPLKLQLSGELSDIDVGTMPCTCRGADNPHMHYFLESERFKALAEGAEVELLLEETTSTIEVRSSTMRGEGGTDDAAT